MRDDEMKDAELEILRQVGNQLQARFGDFLILVRTKDGTRAWNESNETWSRGACDEHITHHKDLEMINKVRADAGEPT